jgi:hypothetical protein
LPDLSSAWDRRGNIPGGPFCLHLQPGPRYYPPHPVLFYADLSPQKQRQMRRRLMVAREGGGIRNLGLSGGYNIIWGHMGINCMYSMDIIHFLLIWSDTIWYNPNLIARREIEEIEFDWNYIRAICTYLAHMQHIWYYFHLLYGQNVLGIIWSNVNWSKNINFSLGFIFQCELNEMVQLQTLKNGKFDSMWTGTIRDKLISDLNSGRENTSENAPPKFFPHVLGGGQIFRAILWYCAPLLGPGVDTSGAQDTIFSGIPWYVYMKSWLPLSCHELSNVVNIWIVFVDSWLPNLENTVT